MHRIRAAHLLALVIAIPVAGVLTACTPATPAGATASATYNEQVTAQVTAIDKARRQLILQSAQGQVAQVDVPAEVRNFDRIEVGDTVRVVYHSQLDVRVAGNAQPIPGVIVQSGMAGAALGEKPAGLWAVRTQRSVQIVSVDTASHTVTYREPDGSLDSLVVQNPANYALADGLRPGTIVDVTKTDTIAVSVDKI